jgi:hypothetical protein
MASGLVSANQMLASQCDSLRLMRDVIRVRAALLQFHENPSEAFRELTERVVAYYRAHGRYLKAVGRLGARVEVALTRLDDRQP